MLALLTSDSAPCEHGKEPGGASVFVTCSFVGFCTERDRSHLFRREWRWLRRWRVALLVGLAVQLAGAPAWAQRPVQQMPEEESSMLPWGIGLGLAAIVCVTAFLNSKRSHLT